VLRGLNRKAMGVQTAGCYRLSAAAQMAGLSSHQARNYLQFGLATSVDRNEAGHHLFDESDIERLRFIGAAMRAGVQIDELRALLRNIDSAEATSVRREYQKLLNRLRASRSTIERLTRELKHAAQRPEVLGAKVRSR
jgi:DNA-binding transcriptional MerR regulator